jgi:hypothetical protein
MTEKCEVNYTEEHDELMPAVVCSLKSLLVSNNTYRVM